MTSHWATTIRSPKRLAGLIGFAALAAGAAVLLGLTLAPQAAAALEGSACTDESGVTVVVDFTDVGGDVEAACATGTIETGRDALIAAGFEPADSTPGMICAIDEAPDPCPDEFTGSYWSYWHDDGDSWASYDVGADSSAPEPGSIEGWRYSDGTAGPTVTPGQVPVALDDTIDPAPSQTPAADPDADAGPPDSDAGQGAADPGDATDDASASDAGELSPVVVGSIVGGAVLVLAVAAVLIATLRPRRDR